MFGFNLILILSKVLNNFLIIPLYLLKLFDFFMKKMKASLFVLSILFMHCQVVNDKQAPKSETNTNVKNRINKQIKKDIDFYIESLNTKKFDELVEMVYPKLMAKQSKKGFKEDLIKQNIYGIYKEIEN